MPNRIDIKNQISEVMITQFSSTTLMDAKPVHLIMVNDLIKILYVNLYIEKIYQLGK